MAKVIPSPRLAIARSRQLLRPTPFSTIALALLAAGCTPGPAAPAQATPLVLAYAALDMSAANPVERATKAKATAPGSSKDDTILQSVVVPDEPAAAASHARCPAEMALVEDRVCVDRWEGSLVEQAPGGERSWSPFSPVDGSERQVRAVSRPGVIPQGYISGKQAKAACAASSKRLCATNEWISACRGSVNTTFPYGATRQHGVCNDDIRPVHPMAELSTLLDLKPGELWTTAMNNPLINQLSQSLLPTGERAGCTNEYGVFDMVGNLHEWTDDPNGTFRGGYYMATTLNGDGCRYATKAHDFAYHDYSTGFRCCMDPEPVE